MKEKRLRTIATPPSDSDAAKKIFGPLNQKSALNQKYVRLNYSVTLIQALPTYTRSGGVRKEKWVPNADE